MVVALLAGDGRSIAGDHAERRPGQALMAGADQRARERAESTGGSRSSPQSS
jgi:hypothetical protein